MVKNIDKLKALNVRLTALLDDPQMGCYAWQAALQMVLVEISSFAPPRRT